MKRIQSKAVLLKKRVRAVRNRAKFAGLLYLFGTLALAGITAMAVMTPAWMELHLWSLPIVFVYLALHLKNWQYLKKAQGATLNPLLGKTAVTLLVFSLLFLIATTAN